MDRTKLKASENCRSCLKRLEHRMYSLAAKYISIADIIETHSESVNLAEVYNECTQLLYEQMNPDWEWICPECFRKMIEFFNFRKMCIESYNKLKEIDSASEERLENSEIELKIKVIDVANILASKDDSTVNDDDYFDNEGDGSSLDEKVENRKPNERRVSQRISQRYEKDRIQVFEDVSENASTESNSDDDDHFETVKMEVDLEI